VSCAVASTLNNMKNNATNTLDKVGLDVKTMIALCGIG
jgi:antitoxin component of RelBE/YafQ-DinJ toxin-antitoxin module